MLTIKGVILNIERDRLLYQDYTISIHTRYEWLTFKLDTNRYQLLKAGIPLMTNRERIASIHFENLADFLISMKDCSLKDRISTIILQKVLLWMKLDHNIKL